MPRRLAVLWLLSALFVLLLSCTGTDTGNPIVIDKTSTGQVAGILEDSLGNPLDSTTVYIRPVDIAIPAALAKVHASADTLTRTAMLVTDSTGAFEVSGLANGRYVLLARQQGRNLGLLHNFTITDADTVDFAVLNAATMHRLAWAVPDSLQGKPAFIPELDTSLVLANDSLIFDALPPGTYQLLTGSGKTADLQLLPDGSTTYTLPVSSSSSTPESSSSAVSSSSAQPPDPSSSSIAIESSSSLSSAASAGDYSFVSIGASQWTTTNIFTDVGSTTCHANETLADCSTYGRFYTFDQAQTACPTGTHLPTQLEWQALITAVGGTTVAGSVLKNATGWNPVSGTDLFGLHVLPTGSAVSASYGTEAYFWTATEATTAMGYVVSFDGTSSVQIAAMDKNTAVTIRCVAD